MIRIGIIGAGPNGTGNAKKLAAQQARCRIAVVADPNREAAQALAAQFDAAVATDYRAMLGDVDAVVISSPNFLHAEHAIACAQAGKHVWIEKPMALTTADADRIVTAVTAAGVRSFIGFSVLFDPAIWKLRELYRAGAVGTLLSLWSRRMALFPPAPSGSWRADYRLSGGHITELLAHELHWIIDVAGMPVSVYCRTASRTQDDPRANEHVWLTLGFAGVTTGTIEGSQMSPVPDYYRGIVGSTGGLCTGDWGRQLTWFRGPKEAENVTPLTPFDKYGHFLDVVEGRAPSLADVQVGRTIVHASERAIESALTGTVVRL
jgi:predicted dehydrogenase